jgi:hypothetical protein
MLEEKNIVTEEEWALLEILHSPTDFVSFFIPKKEQSPKVWNPEGDKFCLRLYQKSMLAYDFLLVEDDSLTDQENFQQRINLGDGIFIGGRIYGKTLVGIEFDALQEMLVHDGEQHLVYSKDQKHTFPRMEYCANYVENHKFFQLFYLQGKTDTVKRSPEFRIELENGHTTIGVIEGQKNPGEAFQHFHPQRKSADEFQQITSLGYSRQVDSKSELGCVERVGGVPDGRRDTPMHEKINDSELKRFRFRYPSMINPHWSKKREEEATKKYNGRDTHAYKTNVLAEEGDVAFGAWDTEDINICVDPKRISKTFEISKELYESCREELGRMFVLTKPEWAEEIIQSSDVGIRPSEIGIWARKAQKWHLLYRIRLMGLVYSEQAIVHDYLATFFHSSCIALDTTEGLGDSIAMHLINEKEPCFKGKEYSKRVFRAKFNEKISMGFLKDAEGKFVMQNNERVEIEEHTDEAAWKLGLSMFRDKLLDLPNDEDLRAQFSAELATKGQNKFIFDSPIPNHIVSMCKVFFLAEFVRHGKLLGDNSPFLGTWI